MLNHSTIRPRASSRTTSKRLGRGLGSGKGVFCGRGCKGQKARTGKKIHPLFEGGQTPLHMRLPKLRGGAYSAKNPFVAVQLGDIQKLADAGIVTITLEQLVAAGYVRGTRTKSRVKLLSGGELTSAVTLSVHAASASAKTIVEKAGGTLNLIG
jgi:large subunit ribosomal protein L15